MIAIASINKRQYSETFIHSHLEHLNSEVLYLFGGYLPTSYSLDKLKTEHPIGNLQDLLLQSNITAVLAEYGPGGVEMMNICEDLKIPMIVHFHGFDAYRGDVLKHYGGQYMNMFNKSAAIVVVSTHMKNQLMGLGCSEEKIHIIPYGIDTGIFRAKPSFPGFKAWIACGRFVEKKGHAFAIKSFSHMLKYYADARLIMVGDGPLLEN